MRNDEDVYWSTSLPKNHEALHALDAFCKEWGGLTRSEATRRILLEWDRLRRGKEVSAWGPKFSTLFAEQNPSDRLQQASKGTQKTIFSNTAAKAASQVLDD